MGKCKRKRLDPIPQNLDQYLSKEQFKALRELRRLGLTLVAVRRPLFQEPITIVKLVMKDRYGVLLKDGQVDYFPDIQIRKSLPEVTLDQTDFLRNTG